MQVTRSLGSFLLVWLGMLRFFMHWAPCHQAYGLNYHLTCPMFYCKMGASGYPGSWSFGAHFLGLGSVCFCLQICHVYLRLLSTLWSYVIKYILVFWYKYTNNGKRYLNIWFLILYWAYTKIREGELWKEKN